MTRLGDLLTFGLLLKVVFDKVGLIFWAIVRHKRTTGGDVTICVDYTSPDFSKSDQKLAK